VRETACEVLRRRTCRLATRRTVCGIRAASEQQQQQRLTAM
jgi:hypothetical protein